MNIEFPKKYLTTILVFLLFIVSVSFKPNKSLAQEDQSVLNPSDISINISPENPSPGDTVNISIGKKTYSLIAPQAGSETSVTINVTSGAGVIKNSLVIKPTVTKMLWEAKDSYVPPFYKGKALPVADSKIRVVVMPEIKTSSGYINPKNMTYSWRQDYTNDLDASGYGRNYFEYISDYLDLYSLIEVSASTTDQKYSVSGNVTINAYNPKLVFYLNDENIGAKFEKSLGQAYTIKDRAVLFAAPYFISPKDLMIPRLVWNWSINNQTITANLIQPNILPVQAQSGVSGTSSVKLEIENLDKIFQTASSAININF